MAKPTKPTVEVKSRKAWRAWLMRNHASSTGVFVITYKVGSEKTHVSYDAIVREALCFGWVDSVPRKLDAARSMRLVTPRKPRSGWSAANKARVAELEKEGAMMPAGRAAVAVAKANGAWAKLDAVDALEVPRDLAKALGRGPARRHFDAFPPSVRRAILEWVANAKRPETRAARIAETAARAARNERANQWRDRSSGR